MKRSVLFSADRFLWVSSPPSHPELFQMQTADKARAWQNARKTSTLRHGIREPATKPCAASSRSVRLLPWVCDANLDGGKRPGDFELSQNESERVDRPRKYSKKASPLRSGGMNVAPAQTGPDFRFHRFRNSSPPQRARCRTNAGRGPTKGPDREKKRAW